MWGIHCAGQGRGLSRGRSQVCWWFLFGPVLCSVKSEKKTDSSHLSGGGAGVPLAQTPSVLLFFLMFERPVFICFSKSESDLPLSRISLQASSHIDILLFSETLPLCVLLEG